MLTLCSRPFRPTPLTLRKVATLCAAKVGGALGHTHRLSAARFKQPHVPLRAAQEGISAWHSGWQGNKHSVGTFSFRVKHWPSAQRGTVTSQELRLEALCKWRCCPPVHVSLPWRSLRKAEPRNGARSSVPVYPRYRVAVQEAAPHGLLRQRLQRHCKATEETAPVCMQ